MVIFMDDEFKEKLLALYPDFNKVTGPYLRKDGRKHICLNNTNLPNTHPAKRKTISYPKALVEVRDNRLLLPNETVDHNDLDFTNDCLTNLVIRDRVDHIKIDALRRANVEAECLECKTKFMLSRTQLYSKSKKAGPFCSRSCSGLYGAKVQNGFGKLERSNLPKPVYYMIDEENN